jgi:dephospho-CoA kinase
MNCNLGIGAIQSFLLIIRLCACMIIAITGNIGTGKSTAALMFEKSGFKVINADEVGHELYRRKDIRKKIIDVFGKSIVSNGEIDRNKLKDIVFYDAKKLRQLNEMMHPAILQEIRKMIKENKEENIAVEGALLIEAGFKEHDHMLLITSTREKQIERLLKKGKYNKEEINNIIDSQIRQEDKISHADYVVENSDNIREFKENIKVLIRELT